MKQLLSTAPLYKGGVYSDALRFVALIANSRTDAEFMWRREFVATLYGAAVFHVRRVGGCRAEAMLVSVLPKCIRVSSAS